MKPLHLLLSVVAVACLAAVPLGVTNTYYLHLIETIMIYAILLFGLDIVVGTGQVSLGHAGLFGIGSYGRRAVLPSAAAHLADAAGRHPDRGGLRRGAGAAGARHRPYLAMVTPSAPSSRSSSTK